MSGTLRHSKLTKLQRGGRVFVNPPMPTTATTRVVAPVDKTPGLVPYAEVAAAYARGATIKEIGAAFFGHVPPGPRESRAGHVLERLTKGVIVHGETITITRRKKLR